jgi:hypothetical protein
LIIEQPERKPDRFSKGTRVKVRGLPGEFTVVSLRENDTVANVYGGSRGYSSCRSVTISRLIRRRNQDAR